LAGWAQAVAIVGTGIGALVLANRQLGAYNAALKAANENEKLRNSIKALDDMRLPTELLGVKASPLDASLRIMEITKTPNDLARFQRPERKHT